MATNPNNISIEPLWNEVTEGDRTVKTEVIDSVGAASHRDAITVTDTAQEITITANKKHIEVHNSGANEIYYGGSGVTSVKGIPLFTDYTKLYQNVKSTFSIYVVCAAGKTSTLRVVEYA